MDADNILKVAGAVARAFVPGMNMVKLATETIDLIQQARQSATPAKQAELDAAQQDLEQRIQAQHDHVTSQLRGGVDSEA